MVYDDIPIMFQLYYPRNSNSDKRNGIHVKYRDVEITGVWDEGSENLATVINNIPQMLLMATREREIQEEISGMSAEIDKFLDESE